MSKRAWHETAGLRHWTHLMCPSPRPSWTPLSMGTPRRATSIHTYKNGRVFTYVHFSRADLSDPVKLTAIPRPEMASSQSDDSEPILVVDWIEYWIGQSDRQVNAFSDFLWLLVLTDWLCSLMSFQRPGMLSGKSKSLVHCPSSIHPIGSENRACLDTSAEIEKSIFKGRFLSRQVLLGNDIPCLFQTI